MMLLGLQAAAWRVPFLPTRAGLGSDLLRVMPEILTVRSPYPGPDGGPGEELVAMPALELDVALIHMNRADQGGNGQFLGPDLYMDDLMAMAATKTYLSAERIVPTDGSSPPRARSTPAHQPAHGRRRGRGARRRALHRVPAGLRPRRGLPEGVRGHRVVARAVGRLPSEYLSGDEADYQAA